ncbi:MAG TPA: hypothetical protein PL048_14840, partial [Leptospiraceae bacterium]|nr:hypothetical protein [Leptospiraceae bacterium]
KAKIMNVEAFFIILNLSFYCSSVFLLFSKESLSFLRTAYIFAGHILLNSILIVGFIDISSSPENYFSMKSRIFDSFFQYSVLSSIFLLLIFLKYRKPIILFSATELISFFSFFFLFSQEEFSFFSLKFSSVSILKAQNPMILLFAMTCFLPKKIIQRFSFAGLIVFLLIFHQRSLSFFSDRTDSCFYTSYLAPEFFLEEADMLCEGKEGVYTYLKSEKTETAVPVYRFTTKPLRKLDLKTRLPLQKMIVRLKFPIVQLNENSAVIYELSRRYRNENQIFIMDIQSRKMRMEGPKF